MYKWFHMAFLKNIASQKNIFYKINLFAAGKEFIEIRFS